MTTADLDDDLQDDEDEICPITNQFCGRYECRDVCALEGLDEDEDDPGDSRKYTGVALGKGEPPKKMDPGLANAARRAAVAQARPQGYGSISMEDGYYVLASVLDAIGQLSPAQWEWLRQQAMTREGVTAGDIERFHYCFNLATTAGLSGAFSVRQHARLKEQELLKVMDRLSSTKI